MAYISSRERRQMSRKEFVEPAKRKYPIPDAVHARNALARVSQFGSPEEKAKVRSAVKRKFPGIAVGGKKKKKVA